MSNDRSDSSKGPRITAIPEGDSQERLICPDCGFVAYQNPKIVVGSVIAAGDRILLCRRAIPPRIGFWTIPAGYLELNESLEHGAAREAREEACAEIAVDAVLGIYSIPRISQMQVMFRASLTHPEIAAGPESSEVALFDWETIPWSELAFPSAVWALREFHDRRGQTGFPPALGPNGTTDFLRDWPQTEAGPAT